MTMKWCVAKQRDFHNEEGERLMVSDSELRELIRRIEARGADVTVRNSVTLLVTEGREVIDHVIVTGVRGIGPNPMGPIAAAEAIRAALIAGNEYENKLGEKKERLEDRADRLRAEADRRFKAADLREEVSGIPFGQPILVGHHSEKRHRAAIARSDANMRKGVEAIKAAKEAAGRAAGIGTGGISSDDPFAVAKLREELAVLKTKQARMVEANKVIRRMKSEPADSTNRIMALEQVGLTHGEIGRILKPYCGRVGYHSFTLSNASANIRRIEARIANLERVATRETAETLHNSGVTVVENVEANRVQLLFPGKPDEATRSMLKSRGFRWSPREGAWQRHLNNAGIYAAKDILAKLVEAQPA